MKEFLAIGYCSRTIGYCFPHCFLETFVGRGQGLDGRGQSRDGGVSPLGKTLNGLTCYVFVSFNKRG